MSHISFKKSEVTRSNADRTWTGVLLKIGVKYQGTSFFGVPGRKRQVAPLVCYVCGDERHEARACPNRGAAAHGGRLWTSLRTQSNPAQIPDIYW
jgi:hypothetical protein